MDCSICCEKYNKTKHYCVKCSYCEFEACRQCMETYILGERVAKCMNKTKNANGEYICDKEWSRKFIVQNFTAKFVNGNWKKNLEQVAYESEKALLPATQGIVEERKEKIRLLGEIRELDNMIQELRQRRRNLEIEYNQGGAVIHANGKNRHFIRACPDENCRGFLNTSWKCGLCEKWTCSDCHVIKGDRHDTVHTCNPDDVSTAKLLENDTKPCPKCATGIFKIEGCDQMWCTQCHTAFSWRTGRIETTIHNPHFYEWQRRNNGGVAPRNIGDIVCGRELDHRSYSRIQNYLCSIGGMFQKEKNDIANMIETTIHLREVQLPSYQVNRVEDNVGLRIAYLENKINEDNFKIKVQRANKHHAKKREIGEVLHLFIQTVTDIVYRIYECVRKPTAGIANYTKLQSFSTTFNSLLMEVPAITAYCNECLKDISTTYGSKPKKILLYSGSTSLGRDVLRNV